MPKCSLYTCCFTRCCSGLHIRGAVGLQRALQRLVDNTSEYSLTAQSALASDLHGVKEKQKTQNTYQIQTYLFVDCIDRLLGAYAPFHRFSFKQQTQQSSSNGGLCMSNNSLGNSNNLNQASQHQLHPHQQHQQQQQQQQHQSQLTASGINQQQQHQMQHHQLNGAVGQYINASGGGSGGGGLVNNSNAMLF